MRLIASLRRREIDPAAYVRKDPLRDGEWIEDLDGTEWADADVPPWLHRCWPQTRARIDGELAERCACGSIRHDGHGPWVYRNSREPVTAQERDAMAREREHCDHLDRLIEAWRAALEADDQGRLSEIRDELRQLEDDHHG